MVLPTNLLTSYKRFGINETEVMVLLQVHRCSLEGNFFPTPFELANCLTIGEEECSQILRKLIQKDLLSIEQNENEQHQLAENYSLEPLWEKLFQAEPKKEKQVDGTIFILFEQEFGRPLSPFEIEMINTWLDEDQISPSLIKAALRESVLMGKLNFKYIDRILREWRRKGIHSVEQAREESKQFHSKKQTTIQQATPKRDTSFYYNWLEGEE